MKKSNAFKYIFIIVILILAIVTVSIYNKEKKTTTNQTSNEQEIEENENVVRELRLAIAQLDTINPIISKNKYVQEVSKIIFDSLINVNEDFSSSYALAREISQTDDITYIIKVKTDVKWSDGSTLKAEDVRYTIELLKNTNSIYSSNVRNVNSAEVIDDETVKVVLGSPEQYFEYNLTFPIMSSEYYKDTDFFNSEKTNTPIGTGKFKITAYDEKVITLEKNTDYWNTDENSVVEKININIYQTTGEIYNDFKNGNIDCINTSQTSVNQYIGTIGFASIEFDSKEYDYIAFNTQNAYLSSGNVRRALSYYIDKNNTIASSYGNTYRVSDFPLDYGNFAYSADVIDNGYNSESASNLLAEDGWIYRNNSWQKSSGSRYVRLSFTLTVNESNPTSIAVAENLRQQWANAGITVTLKKVSSENYYNMINSKTGYDAILMNMSTSYSPNLNTYLGSGNISNYNNDEINQLLAESSVLEDAGQIKEKYKRIEEIYNEEKPFMSIARKKNLLVYNTNLTGNLKPTAYSIYNHIDKWYRKNY
ncbi:MAG: ABC transporter substrate-binding protein [Clostridia bacterium]